MGQNHAHSDTEISSKKLYIAVFINVLLTIAQVIGGLLSGSLSLLADALHNFSDAGALMIAAIAARIAKVPADQRMTYGYKRAEILGALINSTTLVIVGLYLIYEAINRYFDQSPIDGVMVVWVAVVALVIDIFTALLTYHGSKTSMNIKAAFIHNVSDAAASVVVIISGILIISFKTYVVDLVATLIISAYVLYQAFYLIKDSVLILMQSVPRHLNIDEIKRALEENKLIKDAHHIHVWQLDEEKTYLEAHLVVDASGLDSMEQIKMNLRSMVKERFSVFHTTFEFEASDECQNP